MTATAEHIRLYSPTYALKYHTTFVVVQPHVEDAGWHVRAYCRSYEQAERVQRNLRRELGRKIPLRIQDTSRVAVLARVFQCPPIGDWQQYLSQDELDEYNANWSEGKGPR